MSADRRPLRFWQPFNDWWRAELDKQGRRPTAAEIVTWYNGHATEVWGEGAPSVQETRVHAKCLRSNAAVREYFREYRAKKRNQHAGPGYDDDDSPDGADEGYEGASAGLLSPLDPHMGLGLHTNKGGQMRPGSYNGSGLPGAGLGCGLLVPGLLGGAGAYLTGMQAAAWPAGVQGLCMDPIQQQQQDLVRGYMLVQAQHNAALQQQLALAALAAQHTALQQAAANTPGLALLVAGADAAANGAQMLQQQVLQPQARHASMNDMELMNAHHAAAPGSAGLDAAAASGCALSTQGLGAAEEPGSQDLKRRRHTTSSIPDPQPAMHTATEVLQGAGTAAGQASAAAEVIPAAGPVSLHATAGSSSQGAVKAEAQCHSPSPPTRNEDGDLTESPAKRQCVAPSTAATEGAEADTPAPLTALVPAQEANEGKQGLAMGLTHDTRLSQLPTMVPAPAELEACQTHVHIRPPGVPALDNCCLAGPCRGHCMTASCGNPSTATLLDGCAHSPSTAHTGASPACCAAGAAGGEDVASLRALSHEQLVQEVLALRRLLRAAKAGSDTPPQRLSQTTSADTTTLHAQAAQPADEGAAAFLSVLSQLRHHVVV